jgi:hypothetical protein
MAIDEAHDNLKGVFIHSNTKGCSEWTRFEDIPEKLQRGELYPGQLPDVYLPDYGFMRADEAVGMLWLKKQLNIPG